MLKIAPPPEERTLKILEDMCAHEMHKLVPPSGVFKQEDPIAEFEQQQKILADRRFFNLILYGQRMIRLQCIGEQLQHGVGVPHFERGLRLSIVNAGFDACVANDLGRHLTAADCVAANPKFSSPTVRAHLKALDCAGLTILVPDPLDHRRKFIFPTKKFLQKYYVNILAKMCIQYGQVVHTDRLAAATFEHRWLREFQFDAEVLDYALELVQIFYPSSRVIEVQTKEQMAVFY